MNQMNQKNLCNLCNPLTKEKLRDIRAIRWQKKNNPLIKEKTS